MNSREKSYYNQGRISGVATILKRVGEEDPGRADLLAIIADEMEKAGSDIAILLDIELEEKAKLLTEQAFAQDQSLFDGKTPEEKNGRLRTGPFLRRPKISQGAARPLTIPRQGERPCTLTMKGRNYEQHRAIG
jgi:hypothetical protein